MLDWSRKHAEASVRAPKRSQLVLQSSGPQQGGGARQEAPWGAKLDAEFGTMLCPRCLLQGLACCPRAFCFFLPTCLARSGCFASRPTIRLVCSNPRHSSTESAFALFVPLYLPPAPSKLALRAPCCLWYPLAATNAEEEVPGKFLSASS